MDISYDVPRMESIGIDLDNWVYWENRRRRCWFPFLHLLLHIILIFGLVCTYATDTPSRRPCVRILENTERRYNPWLLLFLVLLLAFLIFSSVHIHDAWLHLLTADRQWSLTITANLPIFNRGRLQQTVHQAMVTPRSVCTTTHPILAKPFFLLMY